MKNATCLTCGLGGNLAKTFKAFGSVGSVGSVVWHRVMARSLPIGVIFMVAKAERRLLR